MKTIEELYNIAEHALDGFEAGCYALEYHDVEEDDGIPYEDGELAYAFFSIDSNGCLAYLGYASKQVQEGEPKTKATFCVIRHFTGVVAVSMRLWRLRKMTSDNERKLRDAEAYLGIASGLLQEVIDSEWRDMDDSDCETEAMIDNLESICDAVHKQQAQLFNIYSGISIEAIRQSFPNTLRMLEDD